MFKLMKKEVEQKSGVIAEGKHKGWDIDELGRTYLGYSYIRYKAGEGEAQYMAYILNHPEGPHATWDDCVGYVMPFGKYKGKSLGDLSKTLEGRSYLEYIATWEQMSERDLVRRVVAAFDMLGPAELDTEHWQQWTMPFGKYRNMYMADLVTQDAGYMQYLSRTLKKHPAASKKKGQCQNQFLAAQLDHVLLQASNLVN